jgi:hypothetical protein
MEEIAFSIRQPATPLRTSLRGASCLHLRLRQDHGVSRSRTTLHAVGQAWAVSDISCNRENATARAPETDERPQPTRYTRSQRSQLTFFVSLRCATGGVRALTRWQAVWSHNGWYPPMVERCPGHEAALYRFICRLVSLADGARPALMLVGYGR